MAEEVAASRPDGSEGIGPGAKKRRQGAFLKSGLTENHRTLLEALVQPDVSSIKEAALRIGVPPDTAYQWMLRIKMNASKAEGYWKEFGYYRAKLLKQGKGRFLNP